MAWKEGCKEERKEGRKEERKEGKKKEIKRKDEGKMSSPLGLGGVGGGDTIGGAFGPCSRNTYIHLHIFIYVYMCIYPKGPSDKQSYKYESNID